MAPGFNNEDIDHLSDRKYPQVEEYQQFINLVKVIKKTYQFTYPGKHPQGKKKFSNFISFDKILD